jgi:diguanylate cyclase
LPGRLAGEGFDALGQTTAVVAWIGIGLALVACWLLSYSIGGANVAAPHWFYIPVLIAAVRFGALGAFVTALAAGILAGPLLPADVSAGTAQPAIDWGTRAAFFIVIGQVMAFVFTRSLSALHTEVLSLR